MATTGDHKRRGGGRDYSARTESPRIPVAIASDNTRDPFYAYGDLDAVEVFSQAGQDRPARLPVRGLADGDHPDTGGNDGVVGCRPAESGCPADIVIFRARSYSELIPRPQSDR